LKKGLKLAGLPGFLAGKTEKLKTVVRFEENFLLRFNAKV